MDVLADVLDAMRVGPPRAVGADVRAPWGLEFPAITGATFHVVLDGSCWLTSATAPPLALGTGDIVLVRRGNEHCLRHDPAAPLSAPAPYRGDAPTTIGHFGIDGPGPRTLLLCGAYRFGESRPHPLIAELPDVVHLPAGSGHSAPHHLVRLIGLELGEPQPGRDGVLAALVDATLLYILRAWVAEQSAVAPTRGWAAALTDPAVGAALAAVHAEPDRGWTVAALGVRGGLSRSAFAQRFRALVGTPPLVYVTWWRMTVAARLLRESDAPLAAVAGRVGYGSEFAFAKAFKRAHGTAPGAFRREAAAH